MVYINEFGKRIFPHHLKPYQDELFSSWFCRLAINHGVKPQTFVQNYLGRDVPIWTRDVDLFPPGKLFNLLNNHTLLDENTIKNLFLSSYKSIIYIKAGSFTQNILPLGINHRKRKRFGLLFCWKCFSKGHIYYKKKWRLISSIICTDCNEYLQDCCWRCSEIIAFHRVNVSNNTSTMRFKPLNTCSKCNVDLSLGQLKNKPQELEIQYQNYIDNLINSNLTPLGLSSEMFFRTLLFLTRRSRSISQYNAYGNAIINHFNLNSKPIRGELRYWPLVDRKQMLPLIYKLLMDRDLFKNLLIDYKVSRSRLDPENVLPREFIKSIYVL
jgi:hypothetical protein